MAVQYSNLPGVFPALQNQGLGVTAAASGPRTLVLGVAGQGRSSLFTVLSSSRGASEFGSVGSLTRGMYEAMQSGAQNVILYRIGATAAKLEHVGDSTGAAGYTIETLRRDDDAGGIYTIYYDDSSDRLVVWNSVSGSVVYDNDTTDPVDTGEVIVSGSRAAGGGPDIAGPSAGFALEDVVGLGHAGTAYTAGTDGSDPSRMELFEYLYVAYKDLISQDFDYVIPMDVYLDDKNIVDGYAFSASYLAGITGGDDYPTPDSTDDILGKLFVEQYQGTYYFFWDLDGDGAAELYPTVGSANGTTKIDGTALSLADFHEVNFAYQLARFCYEDTVNNKFCMGVIGTKPPASLALADISTWIGKMPTYTTRSDGTQYVATVADNGSGLLGNKWKAGKYGFRSSTAYGGLILTDTEFSDGIEEEDNNGWPIDIGAYISVVTSYCRMFNAFDTSGRGYVATVAPTYLAFGSSLDEQQAPTNKVIRNLTKVFDVNPRFVDDLSGCGYVHIFEKPKGLTVADSPSGARPDSDYRRFTTMRIVKRVVQAVRDAADPFIGNSFDAPRKAALNNAITTKLDKLRKSGYIQRFVFDIRQTLAQMVNGEAEIELTVVPAWELRRITLTIALAPQ